MSASSGTATKPYRVTATSLRRIDACKEQIELFEQFYPHGLTITPESAVAARDAGLDVEWFILNSPTLPPVAAIEALGWMVYTTDAARKSVVSGERILVCGESTLSIEKVEGGDVSSWGESTLSIEKVEGGVVRSCGESTLSIEKVEGGVVSSCGESTLSIEKPNTE